MGNSGVTPLVELMESAEPGTTYVCLINDVERVDHSPFERRLRIVPESDPEHRFIVEWQEETPGGLVILEATNDECPCRCGMRLWRIQE